MSPLFLSTIDDFDEVSRYLEEHASFPFNLGDFDAIWEEYQAH